MQVSGHKLCKKNKTINLPKVDHLHCFVAQVHAGGPNIRCSMSLISFPNNSCPVRYTLNTFSLNDFLKLEQRCSERRLSEL